MSPELQGLTRTQQETVLIAAMPEVKGNISEVARRRGVSRQTASQILTRPAVSEALEKRTKGNLDKARGSQAKLDRATRKLLSKLEVTAGQDDLAPAEIGGLLKISLEATKLLKEMGLGEAEDANTPAMFAAFMERVKLQAMRVGWDSCKAGEDRP